MKLTHWLIVSLRQLLISWWENTSARPICNTKHNLNASIILFVAVSDDDYSDRLSVPWWWRTLSRKPEWGAPLPKGRNFPSIFWPFFYLSLSSKLISVIRWTLHLALFGVTLHLHRNIGPLITNGAFYPLKPPPWSGGSGWSAPDAHAALVSDASTLLLPCAHCAAPDVFSNWLNILRKKSTSN